jgi:hypothetical protein
MIYQLILILHYATYEVHLLHELEVYISSSLTLRISTPFAKEIDHANSILDYKPDILVLDPHDLDDILTSIMDIAERVNRVTDGYSRRWRSVITKITTAFSQ